jgi:DNA polymerase-3 subunit gamma/tau
MRDALSLLDQAIAFAGGEVSSDVVFQMLGSINQDQLLQILEALLRHDAQALLQQSAELAALGRDFYAVFDKLLTALQQIATLQMVPDMEPTDSVAPQLAEIAAQFNPETVQLLYQIALHGKRDLSWAADPKSGFDMTLLRMLSFQPVTAPPLEDKPLKKPPSPPKPVVTSPPVPEVVSSAPSPVAQAVKRQETPQTAPDEAKLAANDQQIDTIVSVDLSPANWTQIIAELKLSALTRQLAENSAFIRCEQQTVHLSLSPELGHLATAKSQERLQTALVKKLGQDIKLNFTDPGENHQPSQTLAVERAEQQAVKQQQAVESINNDPSVEAIKNTFNARIIESSIKPLD